ncbi:MAG: gliding motility-associated-like protein, partial [Parvicellaceae bacterium]
LNETFMPVVIGADPLQYEFLIFDRWGELIYESQILGQGWDGTYKGRIVKQDVYVWRLRVVNNMNIEKHEYKGHVTILK